MLMTPSEACETGGKWTKRGNNPVRVEHQIFFIKVNILIE